MYFPFNCYHEVVNDYCMCLYLFLSFEAELGLNKVHTLINILLLCFFNLSIKGMPNNKENVGDV